LSELDFQTEEAADRSKKLI